MLIRPVHHTSKLLDTMAILNWDRPGSMLIGECGLGGGGPSRVVIFQLTAYQQREEGLQENSNLTSGANRRLTSLFEGLRLTVSAVTCSFYHPPQPPIPRRLGYTPSLDLRIFTNVKQSRHLIYISISCAIKYVVHHAHHLSQVCKRGSHL